MEIQFFGANCIRITTKKSSVVIDDDLGSLGKKAISKLEDVLVSTDVKKSSGHKDVKLYINQPGEYEVSDVLIQGVPARSYKDEANKYSSTIYKISNDDLNLVVVGHVHPELSDAQLEEIGQADILLIPVGNSDFTLSGTDALKLIKKIEPNIVIPTYYESLGVKYPEKVQTLDEALKELAMEPSEILPKLKIKSSDITNDDTTRLIVLEPNK